MISVCCIENINWGSAADWAMVAVTLGTICLLYKNYRGLKEQITLEKNKYKQSILTCCAV